MPRPPKAAKATSKDSTANLGFEAGVCGIWLAADFRTDDDPARRDWQPCGARQIANGNPQVERGGVHQFGVPPKPARRDSANFIPDGTPQVVSEARDNNANFAWVQHFIHHLAPQGMAGFVPANGPAVAGSSNQSGEGDIRRALIEADLVDCMVAHPGDAQYALT